MTTQERLRDAAAKARMQHPRPMANGEFLHQLLDRAADELDEYFRLIAEFAKQ